MGSPCGAPGAGPGRREDGRGAAPAAESPHPPSARRFLILGNFLNAPGQAPHFLPAAAPAPRAPPQPPVPPAPKAPREPRAGQRRPERAGTRRRGRPGRPEGRAAGDRSTRLPGTEARGQGPSYTMRGTANNGNLSPCRLFKGRQAVRGIPISPCNSSGREPFSLCGVFPVLNPRHPC